MSSPHWESIELVQAHDDSAEWWVALDGKRAIGFGGESARQRAEKYCRELTRIARRARSGESGRWSDEDDDA